jgi:hypothetical protein
VLLWLGGRVIIVVGLGTLGGSSWEVVVEDSFVIFLARKEVRRCCFAIGLE